MDAISRCFRIALAGLAGLTLLACGRPPDPNDPKEVALMQPEVLQRNLKWASDFVNERVAMGEIDDAKGRSLLRGYAEKLTETIKFESMKDEDAWRYGEVFRTAQQWELAEKAFGRACEVAKKSASADRFVNDTLHWAEAKAQLGDIGKAIELARSTFTVEPKDKAPILMSALYEIVPPSMGKGKDVELANLLMDAIDQHRLVLVDIKTESGAAFYGAKAHHIEMAWQKVFDLMRSAKREDLVVKAQERKFKSSGAGI